MCLLIAQKAHLHTIQAILLAGLDGSLSGSQARYRHAEGRAAHVVQANLVAELDGRRIAAVLTADTALQIGAGLAALLNSYLNQLAYAGLVQLG
jgi:hypothetical protein